MEDIRPRFPKYFEQYLGKIKSLSEDDLEALFGEQSPGKTQVEHTKDGMFINYKGEKSLQSLEEAVEYFEIDLDKWDVEKWLANSWDVTGNLIGKRTNYQVKIWLKPKSKSVEEMINLLNKKIKPIKRKIPRQTTKQGNLALEMMITDLHLGKVGFDVETMKLNWSPEECAHQYKKCVSYFLGKVKKTDVGLIILPTGNDFFNIDGVMNTTTKGTPQMTPEFWEHLFEYGCKMVEEVIILLSKYSDVYVPIVSGNHDFHSAFSLGKVLERRFREYNGVTIETGVKRKFKRWGVNGLCWTHGDKIKPNQYGNVFSLEKPEMFSKTKQRYVHVGHYHKNKKSIIHKLIEEKDEVQGTEVEICPSLSPTDRWHYENLYIGAYRRAKAFVYDKEEGKVGEYYYNVIG